MPIRSVTVEEAAALLSDGAVYVDVRSEPEFEQGHPPGALNVPIAHAGAGGMLPNQEFMAVMTSAFGTGERLVVGCKAGGRSRRAAEMLSRAGFTDISDMSPGWSGTRDAFGRALPGWSASGRPQESGLPAGQRYADVKSRTPG